MHNLQFLHPKMHLHRCSNAALVAPQRCGFRVIVTTHTRPKADVHFMCMLLDSMSSFVLMHLVAGASPADGNVTVLRCNYG